MDRARDWCSNVINTITKQEKMTKEETKKIVLTSTISVVGTLIISLILMGFTGMLDSKKEIDKKIQSKADKSYVEKELSLKVDQDVFDEHVEAGNQMQQLLLEEIRMNRQEIRELHR